MGEVGTKGVPRAERERQILDVATDAFGRKGYAAVSIASVAAEAGISKPLVHGYFGTKDGLFAACVRRAGGQLAEAIEEVLARPGDTAAKVEQTLRAVFTVLEPRPYVWNTVFDRTLPPEGEAAEAALAVRARIADQAERGVAEALAAAGSADPLDRAALTEVWVSAVTALVNWWLRHPEQSAEQMVRRSRLLMRTLSTGS
ncbi:TetR/AcrR family transcriptional regulator [Streptomyces physcomitrii]|uniref:TetR/AcrR family transcriptional regulator n=1 Tax=Streptomyces physcomitrii TaxID=2724184 RepID=A0ABX1GW56_9ACTN|nr:TetR/AcrR family transcriptional regulator [Streptomyces physcomitrii]NKI40325.1 TetR/AcrR family transcriptional regulator [Streptomyces physcomitrii]